MVYLLFTLSLLTTQIKLLQNYFCFFSGIRFTLHVVKGHVNNLVLWEISDALQKLKGWTASLAGHAHHVRLSCTNLKIVVTSRVPTLWFCFLFF